VTIDLPRFLLHAHAVSMKDTKRAIVVGYDGSPGADTALEWAVVTAALEHLPVKAVTVHQVEANGEAGVEELAGRVELMLKEAGVEGTAERRSGDAVPVLLDVSQGAFMLVVGSRGHGRVAEAFMGSVSQEVARQASCPVVVVRDPAQPSADKIVVGILGSADSAAGLEFACRRAELTGETVVAVHGWKVGRLLVDPQGNLPETVGQEIDEAEVLLGEAVAGVRAAHPDVVLIQEAIPVAPAQMLVDASSTASLVVTGSRGRGAFAGTLLGSVSHHVLHRAHCTVAIVR
jgi:nucleotide-binding universal stress UspA family protein